MTRPYHIDMDTNEAYAVVSIDMDAGSPEHRKTSVQLVQGRLGAIHTASSIYANLVKKYDYYIRHTSFDGETGRGEIQDQENGIAFVFIEKVNPELEPSKK